MKKALFFSNQGLSIPSLGMELEVAAQLAAGGYEVHVLTCNNCLDSCYFNPTHNLLGCAVCESRSAHFHRHIGIPAHCRHQLRRFEEAERMVFPHFPDMASLMAYEYEGVNIGRGALSSVVSLTRCNVVNSHTHGPLIALQLKAALQALLNARLYIDLIQPEVVYLYNGRFAEVFPLVDLCTRRGLKFYTMEMENHLFKYNLYPNGLPHSLRIFHQQMMEHWAAAPAAGREADAISWFEAKRQGAQTNDKSYLDKQIKGALPDNFDPARHNIALFNSSEDELVSISEWQSELSASQNAAIERMALHFAHDPRLHFYLRVHPNLLGLHNPQTEGIRRLQFPNLTIIPADSPVDTYTLMEACDKTVVFGSTTGIEAAFWGRPSILVGHSFYESLGCVYHAQSWPQLFGWLADLNLPPKDRALTYPYGLFVPQRGRPYHRLKWQGKGNSYFDGQKIRRIYPPAWLRLAAYLSRLPHWLRSHRILHGRSLKLRDVLLLKAENKLPDSL